MLGAVRPAAAAISRNSTFGLGKSSRALAGPRATALAPPMPCASNRGPAAASRHSTAAVLVVCSSICFKRINLLYRSLSLLLFHRLDLYNRYQFDLVWKGVTACR